MAEVKICIAFFSKLFFSVLSVSVTKIFSPSWILEISEGFQNEA